MKKKFISVLLFFLSTGCLLSACGTEKMSDGGREEKSKDFSVQSSSSLNDLSSEVDSSSDKGDSSAFLEDSGRWTSIRRP